jgi:hypothetical protein
MLHSYAGQMCRSEDLVENLANGALKSNSCLMRRDPLRIIRQGHSCNRENRIWKNNRLFGATIGPCARLAKTKKQSGAYRSSYGTNT